MNNVGWKRFRKRKNYGKNSRIWHWQKRFLSKLKNKPLDKTMNDICSQLSDMKISTEILLNIDTWQHDQLDSHGIYKELITSQKVYRVYSYGVFVARKNGFEKTKQIRLVEQDGDILVVC
jgi:hypothetical protein